MRQKKGEGGRGKKKGLEKAVGLEKKEMQKEKKKVENR